MTRYEFTRWRSGDGTEDSNFERCYFAVWLDRDLHRLVPAGTELCRETSARYASLAKKRLCQARLLPRKRREERRTLQAKTLPKHFTNILTSRGDTGSQLIVGNEYAYARETSYAALLVLYAASRSSRPWFFFLSLRIR